MAKSHLLGLFVPHSQNNHRPKLLHNRSLFILIGLFFMAQSAIGILGNIKPSILGFASQIPVETIVNLTNTERKAANLNELKLNQKLSEAALAKAMDMFAKDYWAHNAPDGTEPWYFIQKSGYNYLNAGENLARDFNSAETIVAAWMNSPTHKANILSKKYQDIGIAVVDGRLKGVETTLVVQMFGNPQTVTPKISSTQTNTLIKTVEAEEPITSTYAITPTKITNAIKLSPFDLSRSTSLAFIILIIFTLGIDWFIVWRRNIIRISGKTWAHLTYLSTILFLIALLKQGLII
jgi:hypothetical protein